MRSYL